MSNVINLDSRRKVPSIKQQRDTIKDEVIQDVMRTYAHLPFQWVEIACRKACESVDRDAGFVEATEIAGRYLNATMEANKGFFGEWSMKFMGGPWITTTTK